MPELVIDNFSNQEEVSGEKGNPPFSVADIRNLYIEGGNLHAIKVTPETIPVYPATVLPSIEVRGGPMEYFKYDQSWLMKWLDEDRIARYYPIANLLGVVTVSQDAGYVGTNIYTVASGDRDPGSMIAKSSWLAPAGIGPLVKKSGSGDRAWTGLTVSSDIIKQAACVYGGQIYVSVDSGVTWTAKDSNRNWSDIAGNQAGTRMIACVYGGYLYYSSDSGATWTAKTNTNRNWVAVGISSDGTKLVGVVHGGSVWYSSDSGANWTERTTMTTMYSLWTDITCSSDLAVMYLTEWLGGILKSTDYGATWTTVKSTARKWKGISCSSDGSIVVAIETGFLGTLGPGDTGYIDETKGNIYRSANSGATWVASASTPTDTWWSVSLSYDGSTIIANIAGGITYKSSAWDVWEPVRIDQGYYYFAMSSTGTKTSCVVNGVPDYAPDYFNTWTNRDSSRNWRDIAGSTTGTKLVACVYGGYLYTSTDYGATWTQRGSSLNWYGVCCSSDGTKMYACAFGGAIYSSTDSGVTWSATGSGSKSWGGICCSSNAAIVYASVGKYIYKSIDSGTTWNLIYTGSNPATDIRGLACSSDGNNVVGYFSIGASFVFFSLDGGVTWLNGSIAYGKAFISSDGTKMFCGSKRSIDSGTTWTDMGFSVHGISSDGTKVWGRQASPSSAIVMSIDSGSTFFRISTSFLPGYWTSIISKMVTSSDYRNLIYGCDSDNNPGYIKTSVMASTVSFSSASGYVYVSSMIPDRSKYYLNPFLSRVDSTHVETNIALTSGDYCVFSENDMDYITDIINSDTVEHMGVFYDNMDGKLIRCEVIDQVESVGALFTGTDLTANNDLLYSTPNIEQFGSRMTMANVWELDGTDLCTNGNFESGGMGWTFSGAVTFEATGGRTAAKCALMTGVCTLNQVVASYPGRVFFYAKGDVRSLIGDYSLEADATPGWFRVIMKNNTDGLIVISKGAGDPVYIDDVTCYRVAEQAASIYISGAGTYQEFVIGGDIIAFPTNSRGINGIKAAGEYLYVIKADVTGTIAETGDPENPFHTVEAAFPIGGRYPFKVGNYFGVIRDENSEIIVMLFDGSGYKTINEYWDAPYNKLTFSVPNIIDAPMMSAQFGDKWILSQYQEGATPLLDKWYGSVLSGYDKIGGFQMGRMYGGMFTGQIVGAFTPEYLLTIMVSCGNTNRVKRFRNIKIQNELDTDFDVDAYPAIVGTPITMINNNSYGLNFTSRKARFDISPDASAAISDILVNQITLTFDEVMPDIKH